MDFNAFMLNIMKNSKTFLGFHIISLNHFATWPFLYYEIFLASTKSAKVELYKSTL